MRGMTLPSGKVCMVWSVAVSWVEIWFACCDVGRRLRYAYHGTGLGSRLRGCV